MQQRVNRSQGTIVAAALCVAAGAALAQVTPAEPFGGRPFGASSATPPPQAQAQPQAPVVVQPGTSPVVVQAAPPVVVQPPAPTINSTRPGSSVNPMPLPGGAPQGIAPPAPPPQAAAPVTPPFTSNRNAPPGSAPPVAASQQQGEPVRGLPADAPRLVVTGAVWSADRNKRMLIVNGQPVREGADVGPGVVVESVHREGAVLGFRGNRYNVYF